MGYYINENSKGYPLSQFNKVADLIADGAKKTNATFKKNLVCVVECPTHDAAAYMFNEFEFMFCSQTHDTRKKTWLVYEHAPRLSGFFTSELNSKLP